MVRQEGLEPATYCLEGSCSIQLSYWRIMERVTGIEPASPAWKAGALAVVLHPRHSDKFSLRIIPYRGRSVKGFFAISSIVFGNHGDPPEIRTPDTLLKRQVLCLLS